MGFELTPEWPGSVPVMHGDGTISTKHVSQLQPGDRVGISRGNGRWGKRDPLSRWDRRVLPWRGRFIGNRGRQPRRVSVTGMTEDLAYFLGLWTAEGSIEERIGRVTITCGDPEIGEFLMSGQVLGLRFTARSGRTDQWCLNSYEFMELLRHLDMPLTKAPLKRLPSWLPHTRKAWVCAFVSGLIDGDGYVSEGRNKVGFTTASRRLASEVQQLLLALGVVGRRTAIESQPTARVRVPSLQHRVEMHGSNVSRLRDLLHLRVQRKAKLLSGVGDVLSRRDGVPFLLPTLLCIKQHFLGTKLKHLDLVIGTVKTGSDVTYPKLRAILRECSAASGRPGYQAIKQIVEDWYLWDMIV